MPTDLPPGFLAVGQETATRLARRALQAHGTPAPILILGMPGVATDVFVDDVLATALCDQEELDRRPCNRCAGCVAARARTHPDLVIASPDRWRDEKGSGESIVAAARRWLLDVAGAPIRARWRLVLIENADEANEETQNALLKAIEEPSARQAFVLVAQDGARILPTVRSRCQPLRLRRVSPEVLAHWLVEHEHVTEDQARTLARMAGGDLGMAVALARTPSRVEWQRRTQIELLALLDRGRAERMGAVRELLDSVDQPDDAARSPAAKSRQAADAVLAVWADLARDLAVAAAGVPRLAVASEVVGDLGPPAARASTAEFATAARAIDALRSAVLENVSPRLALEMAMVRWPTSRDTRLAQVPHRRSA